MRRRRTNRERADECWSEALACLDQIGRNEAIGFPTSPVVIRSCLILSEMCAVYMTEPDGDFGDISDRFRK
jgi:hypothetical protein